jgi:hypothetical protein
MPFSSNRRNRPPSYDEFTDHPPNDLHLNEEQQHTNNPNLNIDTISPDFSTLVLHSTPPKKNCCTRPIASFFLLLVASALIATWQLFPAEEIAKTYIPKFDAPANPYTGPEAGSPGGEAFNASGGGGISFINDDILGDFDINLPGFNDDSTNNSSSVTVPSFMTCPDDGSICCNGSTDNCVLTVNQMMFTMVHNAMAAEENGFFAGYNQYRSLESALVAGHRGINLDVCECNGILQFCHNVCDLGERYPNEVFTNVLDFLEEYPSEVVVLLFEASSQGTVNWNTLYSEMEAVDGFADKMYSHTVGEEWPTMKQLVRNDKRIIVFFFNGGYCENESCPAPFHRWFSYAAETQYASSSISDLSNVEYSCKVTRGPGSSEEERTTNADFFVVNNFVTPPDPDAAVETNSKEFLAERLSDCANYANRRPNFVYVDFWSQGVAAELVQYANGQMAAEVGARRS